MYGFSYPYLLFVFFLPSINTDALYVCACSAGKNLKAWLFGINIINAVISLKKKKKQKIPLFDQTNNKLK